MSRILGLDQGSNSIGWAVVDYNKDMHTGSIIDCGVRIFQMGVENLGQGEKEKSRNAARSESRAIRRQFYRKRMRKSRLRRMLKDNKMCPTVTPEYQDWLRLNPYEIRANAAINKVSLLELGRAFYHMIQRRGYLSNSRLNDLSDESTIYQGKDNMSGIAQTKQLMENATLGQALYQVLPTEHAPFEAGLPRVRARYTTRRMYIDEFETIWEKQSTFHKSLNPDLKEELGGRKKDGYKKDGVLFFQRPLKSQIANIGKCVFEHSKRRRRISAPDYEEFTTRQFVNSIRCNGEPLLPEEKETCVDLLLKNKKPKFNRLRKSLKKLDAHFKFNYEDKHNCPGGFTNAQLASKKIFGVQWFDFDDEKKDRIWKSLIDFDDIHMLNEYAVMHFDLTNQAAEIFAKLKFPTSKQGHGSLSKKALGNILPFLRLGYEYDIAVTLGGVKNAFGADWVTLSDESKHFLLDNVEPIVRAKLVGGYIHDLRTMLAEQFGLTTKQLGKLYHHSSDIKSRTIQNKLPVGPQADADIASIRNPIVVRAMFELRKVVNELIEKYGPFDEIKLEMARDLKANKSQRQRVTKDNRTREAYTNRIVDELKAHNAGVTYTNILKYKLWEECQRICPFTQQPISFVQLFGKNPEVEIEHIIPFSRCLNDSFNNKTLCFSDANRAKGNRTPHEYFIQDYGEEKWISVKNAVMNQLHTSILYPNRYSKFKRFVTVNMEELDGFLSRQLNDTRYISRVTKNYLAQICKPDKIHVSPGQLTSDLRYLWGLNTIINFENEKKNRSDQRHHAIDAIVIAVITRSVLLALTKNKKYNKHITESEPIPEPWDHFRSECIESVNKILVSYHKNKKTLDRKTTIVKKKGQSLPSLGVGARGTLHKESVYGKRTHLGEEKYHIRKPITEIKDEGKLNKIADAKIRRLILNRLHELGIDTNQKKFKIPPETYVTTYGDGEKIYHIFLPNENGDHVPVKKVRIKEEIGNAVNLNETNQWVNPRNNHHVIIYEDDAGIWKEEIVTFWEVIARKRSGLSAVILPPDCQRLINKFQINDMFLIGLEEDTIDWSNFSLLSQHLYRIQKLSSMNYSFRHHLASTLDVKEELVRIQSLKTLARHNVVPVKINATGQIQVL